MGACKTIVRAGQIEARRPSERAKSRPNSQVRAKKRSRSATQPAERIFFSFSNAARASEQPNAAPARCARSRSAPRPGMRTFERISILNLRRGLNLRSGKPYRPDQSRVPEPVQGARTSLRCQGQLNFCSRLNLMAPSQFNMPMPGQSRVPGPVQCARANPVC